jgi:hypothetical protein
MALIGVRRSLLHKRAITTTVTTTTLDPVNKGASQTLSNGNLTLTGSGGNGIARSIASHASGSGKYYFEVTMGTCTNAGVGFVNNAEVLTAGWIGDSPNTAANLTAGGWSGDTSGTITGPALVSAHVYGLAIDLSSATKAVWILDITGGTGQWNANATANPATGVNGNVLTVAGLIFVSNQPIYAGGSCNSAANTMTFNFGATAYAGTPPSGFGNW